MRKLTVEAKAENLDTVKQFVNHELEKVSCSYETLFQIDLVVEELFVNIANYAYEKQIGTATVLVEILDSPSRVEITFMDYGVPYDPLSLDDPDFDLPIAEKPIGGLGIFIVKQSMDHVSYEYNDGKNILLLKKNL